MDKLLKRLATRSDNVATVNEPFSPEELAILEDEYAKLTPMQFAKRYIDFWSRPVKIEYDSTQHDIQMNFCTNPFCKWYGEQQLQYDNIKYKPSRYKIVGREDEKNLFCNPDPVNVGKVPVISHMSGLLSNWAIAEEITRLATHSTIREVRPKYEFHYDHCQFRGKTPEEAPHLFQKWGKTPAKSQRWHCKHCEATETVRALRNHRTNYEHKRSELLVRFAGKFLSRTPVKKTIKTLGTGVKTYYDKLEVLYLRCLEFLDEVETASLREKELKELRLSSDQLIYHLNHLRRKGAAKQKNKDKEDPNLVTQVIASCDANTRYVFRVDVAYDWDVTLDDVQRDTDMFKDDHLPEYARKNARLRGVQYFPKPPTANDVQSQLEYEAEIQRLEVLSSYVRGLHTTATYTAIAHFWLLRQTLNVKEWQLVSDGDGSLISALSRVFAKEINGGYAHQFVYKLDHRKSVEQAKAEYDEARRHLLRWASSRGLRSENIGAIAVKMLTEELNENPLYQFVALDGGGTWPVKSRFIRHPLATQDQGYREVSCLTPLHNLSNKDTASLLCGINSRATDEFFQIVRRSINILERPLMGARGDGKSYIYANLNPKYAHQLLTIVRTHYNFCLAWGRGETKMTPAQRLGLTDKVYEMKDIIYWR